MHVLHYALDPKLSSNQRTVARAALCFASDPPQVGVSPHWLFPVSLLRLPDVHKGDQRWYGQISDVSPVQHVYHHPRADDIPLVLNSNYSPGEVLTLRRKSCKPVVLETHLSPYPKAMVDEANLAACAPYLHQLFLRCAKAVQVQQVGPRRNAGGLVKPLGIVSIANYFHPSNHVFFCAPALIPSHVWDPDSISPDLPPAAEVPEVQVLPPIPVVFPDGALGFCSYVIFSPFFVPYNW